MQNGTPARKARRIPGVSIKRCKRHAQRDGAGSARPAAFLRFNARMMRPPPSMRTARESSYQLLAPARASATCWSCRAVCLFQAGSNHRRRALRPNGNRYGSRHDTQVQRARARHSRGTDRKCLRDIRRDNVGRSALFVLCVVIIPACGHDIGHSQRAFAHHGCRQLAARCECLDHNHLRHVASNCGGPLFRLQPDRPRRRTLRCSA